MFLMSVCTAQVSQMIAAESVHSGQAIRHVSLKLGQRILIPRKHQTTYTLEMGSSFLVEGTKHLVFGLCHPIYAPLFTNGGGFGFLGGGGFFVDLVAFLLHSVTAHRVLQFLPPSNALVAAMLRFRFAMTALTTPSVVAASLTMP